MFGFYTNGVFCFTYLILLLTLLPVKIIAQLTKDDVRELLIIQGNVSKDNADKVAEVLYQAYIDKTSYNSSDLITASIESIGSGIFMGIHESYSASYTHSEWLPVFMRLWYNKRFGSDGVYAKSFTAQKVFRELEYITDRPAYYNWNRFFGNQWYLAFPANWLLRNLSGEIIRHRMRYGYVF